MARDLVTVGADRLFSICGVDFSHNVHHDNAKLVGRPLSIAGLDPPGALPYICRWCKKVLCMEVKPFVTITVATPRGRCRWASPVEGIVDLAVKVKPVQMADVDGLARAAPSPNLNSGVAMPVVRWIVAKSGDGVVGGAVCGELAKFGDDMSVDILRGMVTLKDWIPSVRGGGTAPTGTARHTAKAQMTKLMMEFMTGAL